MKIPTVDEIEALHKKYAPTQEALQSVWTHCQIVNRIALQVAENVHPTHSLNKELLGAGALLHDIGVYRLYKDGVISGNYITHGLRGYELLKEEGLDEEVCRFALLHTGVGINKEEIVENKLPLPARDYIPETDEERIVAFADKFHSKTEPPIFNSAGYYTEYLRTKFGEVKAKTFEAMLQEFGAPELESLMKKYGQGIR